MTLVFLEEPFVGGVEALRFPFAAFLGGMVRMAEFEKLFDSFGSDVRISLDFGVGRDPLRTVLVSPIANLNIN